MKPSQAYGLLLLIFVTTQMVECRPVEGENLCRPVKLKFTATVSGGNCRVLKRYTLN